LAAPVPVPAPVPVVPAPVVDVQSRAGCTLPSIMPNGLWWFVNTYPLVFGVPPVVLAWPILQCASWLQLLFFAACVAAFCEGSRLSPPGGSVLSNAYMLVFTPAGALSLALVGLHVQSAIQLATSSLAVVFLLLVKEGFCMSVCLHRYAAHAAFKTHWATSLALGWLGCMAGQGGPIWWASKHRCHHKHCETPRDPHSPKMVGEVRA